MGTQSFWHTLTKPIMVLAPMADVTDASFRRIIATYGKPDVMWTEFVSADGLIRATEAGKKKLLRDLLYSEIERPIVAQLFSSHPDMMEEAARLVVRLGFDGLDINMGCPDRSIEKQGAGSAHIKNPSRAQAVIMAAKEGVRKEGSSIPVSVKTRTGYNKDEIETWIPALLDVDPAVITLHARTRKEMSKVPARWETVARTVELRNASGKETLIFGNGDALSVSHAKELASNSGADGVMLGRAIFGNPWLFSDQKPTFNEKVKALEEHIVLFEELLGDIKSFALMKKHFKSYLSGFDEGADLRKKLMEVNSFEEACACIVAYGRQ